MGNATQRDAPIPPRVWLWLARVVLAIFFIASLLIAAVIVSLFVGNASSHWREWGTILWFTVCVAAVSCGLIPYILVARNHWRERTRAKGLAQALIIGTFWFFVGWIIPFDSAFHGTPGFGPVGGGKSYTDLLETSLAVFLGCGLPALLLLISGMKLLNFRSALNPAAASTDPGKHASALRASVGAVIVLLLLPTGLVLFTLGRNIPILYVVPFEAMLLTAAIPFTLVWRNLCNDAVRSPARKIASALATGCLGFLATCGAIYVFVSWEPRRMSTWAEIGFLALLALANVGVLWADRRYAREAEGKKRFAWGSLAVALSLAVFWFFIMLVSASV